MPRAAPPPYRARCRHCGEWHSRKGARFCRACQPRQRTCSDCHTRFVPLRDADTKCFDCLEAPPLANTVVEPHELADPGRPARLALYADRAAAKLPLFD